ncbi:MAG: bile acid:sodium symporter family protein [Thermoguttaceae bacterium]|jgi:BASS family bile acid:Na+ symporter
MSAMIRPIALMCAFVVGWFIPQGAQFSWTIPWFVRYMLFMTFLGLNVRKMRLYPSHFIILALNILIGVGACWIFKVTGNASLAAAAFFTGMAPTASAAPAIASFLRREVEYVVTSLLLTTLGVAIAIPTFLPWAVGGVAETNLFWSAFLRVGNTVLNTIVWPIVLARVLRALYPPAQTWTKRYKSWTFYAWVLMIVVLACRASAFIRDPMNGASPFILVETLALSLAICVTNFVVGYLVGEKGLREEASQSLGQKNTGAMISFAVIYADPIAALGPTLYVLWHNSWNALQLQWLAIKDARAEHRANRARVAEESRQTEAQDAAVKGSES